MVKRRLIVNSNLLEIYLKKINILEITALLLFGILERIRGGILETISVITTLLLFGMILPHFTTIWHHIKM